MRLAGRASIFLTFAAGVLSFISVKIKGTASGCDTRTRRFGQCERLANVLSTNYIRRTDENPLLWSYHYAPSFFLAPKMIQLLRKFVSQNKAKNAGRSRKNAGMREIQQNAGFPARLRDGLHLWYAHNMYIQKDIEDIRIT